MFHICQSKCFCASLTAEGGGRGRENVLYCFGEVRAREQDFCQKNFMQVVLPDHTTREEEDKGFSFLELGKQKFQIFQFAIVVLILISV